MSEVHVNELVAAAWGLILLVSLTQAVTWRAARGWLLPLAGIAAMRSADRLLHANGYHGSAYTVLAILTGVTVLVLGAWLLKGGSDARRKDHAQLLLENVFHAAGDGMWVIDAAGRTAAINPAAEQLTGWRDGEVRGSVSHDLIHHSHADGSPYPIADCPIFHSLERGEVEHVDDEVFWRRDGSSFPVVYSTTPVNDGRGRRIGAVQVFRDATGLRRAEADRRRVLEEELRQRQAFEVNDQIVQRLVVADLAMRMERSEQAAGAIQAALDAAKGLINDWAEQRPGDLVRSVAASSHNEELPDV
jgi:PAS domain S-box-containing protein